MSINAVAPLAGAWIEIKGYLHVLRPSIVAPLAGAWIEIGLAEDYLFMNDVAPLAGAWIEITEGWDDEDAISCRSPRGSVD